MRVKTRGNSGSERKSKVYFIACGEDCEKYFDTVADMILKQHNCAVYCNNSNEQPNDDELELMNLIVIGITGNIIYNENSMAYSVFKFAEEKCIPILPIILERLSQEEISKLNLMFKDRQCLNYLSDDETEIAFDEKLSVFIKSTLTSNELADKVRAAFDAYIFLSYRKIDRAYANKLMKLIHKNDFARDIAIWFDEFLTPGENFNSSIKTALEKSDLFVLNVTPSLIDAPNARMNFVREYEYPMAVKSSKRILPVEMAATDKAALEEQYKGIPICSDPNDEAAFSHILLNSLKDIAKETNDNDPLHNFLIGLAYLEGIDVEKNSEIAVKLISGAAEMGLSEAMSKLSDMYLYGNGVQEDKEKAIGWKKAYIHCLHTKYTTNKNCISAVELLNECTSLYEMYLNFNQTAALGVCQAMMEFVERSEQEIPRQYVVIRFGIIALIGMATIYSEHNDYYNALECAESAFNFIEKNVCRVHSEDGILLAKYDYKKSALKLSSIYRAMYDFENQQKYITLSKKYDDSFNNSVKRTYKHTALDLQAEADSLTFNGNSETAIELYKQAADLFEVAYYENDDDECLYLKLKCMFEEARNYTIMQCYNQSIKISLEIIDILDSNDFTNDYNSLRLLVATYEQLVCCSINLKNYDNLAKYVIRYISCAEQAINKQNEFDTRKDLARCHMHIAEYSFNFGDFENAINHQRVARNIFCKHYDEIEKYKGIEKFVSLDLAECCAGLGKYYRAAGNSPKAVEYYSECYTVLCPYIDGKDLYLHNIADDAFMLAAEVEKGMNNIDNAFIHYNRAFDNFFNAYQTYGTLPTLYSSVMAVLHMAENKANANQIARALEYYNAAVNLAYKEPNNPILRHYTAIALKKISELDKSEQGSLCRETAIKLWQKLALDYPDVELYKNCLKSMFEKLQ